ncbi:hypothetical protein SAMN05428944_7672 [Streptomyces sp. 1222.5]|nr:hypothetical protein BX260_0413 [Streptomyces sp. 5112.2]SED43710.1 hypothetical protein SAMN05428944_7672 [Streptomyces sp. 1222.5]
MAVEPSRPLLSQQALVAAVVGTAWVALTDGAPSRAHVVQSATGDGSGKSAPVSLLPVTSSVEHPPAQGSGGCTVPAAATRPAFCVHVDQARGMTDVRVASAKAEKSTADGTWQVEVTLSPADRTRFAALTGSLADAPAPRSGFAIIIDGKLWGNSLVTSSITGGRLDIVGAHVGDRTGATAYDLARRLDPAGEWPPLGSLPRTVSEASAVRGGRRRSG